jgi:hypothetical protein
MILLLDDDYLIVSRIIAEVMIPYFCAIKNNHKSILLFLIVELVVVLRDS